MSIEVRVPEEIKEYKESIIAGLSVRQLICGGAGLLCGVHIFAFEKYKYGLGNLRNNGSYNPCLLCWVH